MLTERSQPPQLHRNVYNKVTVPDNYYDLFQLYRKLYEEYQKLLASHDALGEHASSLEARMKNAIETSTKYGLAYMHLFDMHRRIFPVESDDSLLSPDDSEPASC
jgi:hypothetical protein